MWDFCAGMADEQRQRNEAIAMDMWNTFIHAIKSQVTHVKIVFDFFHVVSSFGKVIYKIRNTEYRKVSKEDKRVF